MPPPTPRSARAALLLWACAMLMLASGASAAASWNVGLVPTPITRKTYEARTALPATCFKISQAGDAPPPTSLTIRNVAQACARTNKPPAFTVDGIPQDGARSALFFGTGSAALSARSSTLTLTLPAWAKDQKERVVCISTNSGVCGTFAKICGNRSTCPVVVGSPGASPVNLKTAPLATASHAMVLEFANAPSGLCVAPSLFPEIAADYTKDARAQLAKELGRTQAAQITVINFRPQLCSPIADAKGKPTDRTGLGGFVTVVAPPDLVDDVLKVLDRESTPAPSATATACGAGGGGGRRGGGCSKAAVALSASFAVADPGNTVAYSSLMKALQTYIASGFNLLTYNPIGDFTSPSQAATTTKLDVSNWLLPGKIYDMNTVAAACADNACFSNSSLCSTSLAASTTASTFERQKDVFGQVSVSGEYLGVTASASGAFTNAQNEVATSNALSIKTYADCTAHTFNLIGGAALKFSDQFLLDVNSTLASIVDARNPAADPATAKLNLRSSLQNIYDNYGTHVPQSINYGGLMRLELLMKTDALQSSFKSSAEINVAVSHAVADLTASGGTRSDETKQLMSSTSSYSFTTVPPIPSVSLTPVASGGYKINPEDWSQNLQTVDKSTLYPRVVNTRSLADLFSDASPVGSNGYQQFGSLPKANLDQLNVLSRAFLAFVINDPTLWPSELKGVMPPLLQNPNYMKDGRCVGSTLIVKVSKKPTGAEDAAFTCVTCVRGLDMFPTDPDISVANPDNTARCFVGPDSSVKAECVPCRGCQGQGPMCPDAPADPNADWGAYQNPAKCDGCVQCVSEANCRQDNNYNGFYGSRGDGGPAKCLVSSGRCVQCLSSDNCKHNGPCSTGDGRYVCT